MPLLFPFVGGETQSRRSTLVMTLGELVVISQSDLPAESRSCGKRVVQREGRSIGRRETLVQRRMIVDDSLASGDIVVSRTPFRDRRWGKVLTLSHLLLN